jgi:hypothetical protein
VATVVVSRWEGELDVERARGILAGVEEMEEEESQPIPTAAA